MATQAEDEEMTPKYIYLARRHSSLNREEFTQRWRQHGALGMSMPGWENVIRYVHCDTLTEGARMLGIRDDYDGVGMIWSRSNAARLAHIRDEGSQMIMELDEARTFSEPVANFGVLCAEEVLRDFAPKGVKLIRFLMRHRSVSESLFNAAWDRHRRALLNLAEQSIGLERYVINRPLQPERPEGWGLDVNGIEELWFDHADALARFQRAIMDGSVAVDDDGNWARSISLMTNEVVLHSVT